MHIEFEPLGVTQQELDQLLKFGLKYDKRQKKQMLAASNAPRPTAEDVKDFETKIGLVLPEDYKKFLVEKNGGVPKKSKINTDLLGTKVVQQFYAIKNPAKNYTLSYLLEIYSGRIPDRMLPIADDPAGNLYLCQLQPGDTCGKIYFWNHEEEADGEPQPYFDNIIHVADSFSDFLSLLR